ncbi:MAG: hypothetical protein ABIZ80_24335, partial [Bryobacteraceae bacterium]
MRFAAALLFACAAAAQIPATDARNTNTPGTDTHFAMPVFQTRAAWEAHAARLRKQILSSAGLLPLPEKNPLRPTIFGRIEHNDYAIEKVYLETLPGYYLAGNLYRPVGRKGKLPAVLTPHGHWLYGRLENQPLASIPARCISLARQGYVVFAYDMVGYNDTVQTPHAFGNPREQLWSFGPLGLQLWNSIRVVDFLVSLPEVDASRIAMTGASGGGTQTFLLTAVDSRVAASAPVNMISAIMQGGSPCENAPGLRVGTSNLEIGAMMAPRPLLMVAATGDWTRNTPREEYPAVQGIYELYGKPSQIESIQIDAPHNYNQQSREAVYRFFGNHLLGEKDPEKLKERSVRVERLPDMLVFHGRALPANALRFDQIFDYWVDSAKRQSAGITDAPEVRERLALALRSEWPESVLSETNGEAILLGRAGKGDRIPGQFFKGTGDAALVLHPEGAKAARQLPAVRQMIREGKSVLLIDAFQTGSAVAPRDRSGRYFLTFNLSDDACRVQDVLTALRFLQQTGSSRVHLVGEGKSAIWATFAASVSGVPVSL